MDTNVLIYFLEGIEPYASKVENLLDSFMKRENDGVISPISIAEILVGYYAANDEETANKVKSLLQDLTKNGFEITSVTFQIADIAAEQKAKRGGRLPDAIITATAVDRGANLIYSQDEDLQRFSQDIKVSRLV